jgi:predicted nucleotidyltransferase
MDAKPLLERIVGALSRHGLEAVLIGNAGAALQGAPVTTVDFDFMFRKTATNMRKLKAVATELGASLYRPFHPASNMYRLVNDDIGLQVDFLVAAHGIRSFESLWSRSVTVELDSGPLRVAALRDIIRSKAAANRPRDRAVLPVLKATLDERKKQE